MIIDKEGKLFGKISVIDIIAVLAIISVGFGVYARFTRSDSMPVKTVETQAEIETQKIEYTMIVKAAEQGMLDALLNRGEIYKDGTEDFLGEITNITSENAIVYTELANGRTRKSELPDRYDITLTIKLDARTDEKGYYTDKDTAISAGGSIIFSSKYAKATGEIISIKETE